MKDPLFSPLEEREATIELLGSSVPRREKATSPPPLNSDCQIFPKGPPFGITLRHPFLDEQT